MRYSETMRADTDNSQQINGVCLKSIENSMKLYRTDVWCEKIYQFLTKQHWYHSIFGKFNPRMKSCLHCDQTNSNNPLVYHVHFVTNVQNSSSIHCTHQILLSFMLISNILIETIRTCRSLVLRCGLFNLTPRTISILQWTISHFQNEMDNLWWLSY